MTKSYSALQIALHWAIAVLIAAPFSEEPWLKDQYGTKFEDYSTRVRRFL